MADPTNEKNEHAQALAAMGASKGGLARAESMSPDARSAVAKKAAMARWGHSIPRASHYGELAIGGMSIPCAVLADGTRVLTQWGFYRAIGRSGRPAGAAGPMSKRWLPFLALDNLKPSFPKSWPIRQSRSCSSSRAASRLTGIGRRCCQRSATSTEGPGGGGPAQDAAQVRDCVRALVRGLAHVGIIALVDEATGYQADRARDALAKILERFIAKELRPWVKTFPAEFYEHLFRLRGWQWKGMTVNRPQVVAHYTKDLVYARLAPRGPRRTQESHAAQPRRQAQGQAVPVAHR